MESYRWFLVAHVASGVLALASFWVAAFLRKGSARHRRVGQTYLVAMVGVIASGVPLAMALIERGRPVGALFLAFLLLLTTTACINALRAIRLRASRARYFGGLYWSLAFLNALAGIGIVILGVQTGSLLLQIFGGIGVLVLVDGLRNWRKSARLPTWWLREHYGAMIGNGVATHIAFFSIGLRTALPGIDPAVLQYLAWFGPLAVAVVAAIWLDRRYGRPRAAPGAGMPVAVANAAGR